MLDHLLADRMSALSPADISARFDHDASPGTPLHMALAANDKIEVLPDGSFTYKVCPPALFQDHALGVDDRRFCFLLGVCCGFQKTTY